MCPTVRWSRLSVSSSIPTDQEHLDQSQVVAYLDRMVPRAERDRIEAHLAECAECRDEIVEARELMRQARRPRRLLINGGFVAVAAALLFVVWPSLHGRGANPSSPTFRDGVTSSALVAYAPIGEASRADLRFVWKPDPDATTYRLTLTSEAGAPLWAQSGTDTSVILPDSIVLRRDERYFWIVDALLANGGTRSTGLQEFRRMK
jgi:hypothetical protein